MEPELLAGLLKQLLWFYVPLLTGFFAGILINGRRWFWRGLLAGAIGAVTLCYITVQIIYSMGYAVVEYDILTGTVMRELTAYQAFLDAIYISIFWGAIAGIVGAGIASWLRNRRKKRPPIPSPPPPPPQKFKDKEAEDPLKTLKIRYAKGEISSEEYEDMKRKLGYSEPPTPTTASNKCPFCGVYEIQPGDVFCPHCGKKIVEANVERMEKKKDVEELIRDLKNESVGVRMNAATVLGRIGDARAVEPLIQALKDEEKDVRSSAAWALGMIGDARAVGPLIQALKDRYLVVLTEAAKAIMRIGDPKLIMLDEPFGGLKPGLVTAMEIAIEYVTQVLRVEDSTAITMAILTLTQIGERAVEPLIQTLMDKNRPVRFRWGAAAALGWIGDERAVEPLTQALKDEDEEVRKAAKEALEKIKAKKSYAK